MSRRSTTFDHHYSRCSLPPLLNAQAKRKRKSAEISTETLDPENLDKIHEPPEIDTELAVLPIRGAVMFPGTVMPLTVGRTSTLAMVEKTLPQTKQIAVIAQRDEELEDPGPDDLYDVGVAGQVLKLIRQPDETVSLIVHGIRRIHTKKYLQTKPFMRASVEVLEETRRADKRTEAEFKSLRDASMQLIKESPNAPEQAQTLLLNIDDAGDLADFLAANLSMEVEQKQDLLEELNVPRRLRAVQSLVGRELEVAKLQSKIRQDVEDQFSDTQRRVYLREQLKAIQRELGEDEGGAAASIEELRQKLLKAAPPEYVMEEAERELNRLNVIPPASPEYSVILTYLETIAELPWSHTTEDQLNLKHAREILDRDHHDLEKVKNRLVEFLAVRKLTPQGRSPILCLVGPPGVGKTSLGQSIADALGRHFVRISLGGIRDEAEIRGHRRTYIGAMPGRIIQEMRRATARNPVMMLDEVDKIGSDFRGDPASALLEVLDPRQNHEFVDRYLDVAFDLSQVIFIATANYMDPVPPALRDRMEVIEIPGYSPTQKMHIARKYLVPRQLEEHGLKKSWCRFNKTGLQTLIGSYTREAGVRELERQIASVCRSVAAKIAAKMDSGRKSNNGKPHEKFSINPEEIRELLGPEKYVPDQKLEKPPAGVVTGLAFTPVGGQVLHVEATQYPGKGEITLTGHIGEVMRESAQAAVSLVRSRATQMKIDDTVFSKTDIHLHVPAGAIPKDGPSAGVAMFTALASLLTDQPVPNNLAMTGEITLRGEVLAIGGLKEKTLGAMQAGIKHVILPKANEKDLPDIPDEAKKTLKFTWVSDVGGLLKACFS